MNRINKLFQEKNKEVMSIYFPAGFPEKDSTMNVLQALQRNGVNMVEIGIPFSDPMADGPVIQQATQKALNNGMSLRLLFSQLKNMRQTIDIPVVLMGYLNPIMQYGFEEFCKSCCSVGVDGVIIPDLPFSDYIKEYKEIADIYDIKVIMLITPETSEDRIIEIDNHTDGFIYMVSSASTTGAQDSFGENIISYFSRINNMKLNNPRLIGFGISNKATKDAATDYANGIIIGSKFVKLLEEYGNADKAMKKIKSALES